MNCRGGFLSSQSMTNSPRGNSPSGCDPARRGPACQKKCGYVERRKVFASRCQENHGCVERYSPGGRPPGTSGVCRRSATWPYALLSVQRGVRAPTSLHIPVIFLTSGRENLAPLHIPALFSQCPQEEAASWICWELETRLANPSRPATIHRTPTPRARIALPSHFVWKSGAIHHGVSAQLSPATNRLANA